jgi:uncharacterized membrane protein
MAALMAVYCVVRYDNFAAGLDLSIFDQAIWHYSHFQAADSTIKGFNLLGDHFHPAIALLAPLYWVWSDPRMLLVGSSLLVASSIIPVFLFARRRLPRLPSYGVAVAYALFWGLQIGVGYEFHENELGPLLIALAVLFCDLRRWGWFYVAIALTLMVKEDLSFFVVFFGIYLLTVKEWRRGAALIVVGTAWYVLVTRVAIPHFSPTHSYGYWTYQELGKNVPAALLSLLKAPWRIVTIGLSPSVKAHTLLYLFAPFLFCSLASRWVILAVPLLAERFLSTRVPLWDTNLDYSLTIAPVLAMSAAAGLSNLEGWLGPRLRRVRTSTLAVGAGGAMVVVSLALTFSIAYSPFRELVRSSFYQSPWFKHAASLAISKVPPGAPVNANDSLLTHLNHRSYASEIMPGRPLKGYVIADLVDPVGAPSGNPDFAHLGLVLTGYLRQATPIYYFDGWLVAKRPPAGEAPSNGIITPLPRSTARRLLIATQGWRAALFAVVGHLFGCYSLLARREGCSVAGTPSLTRQQQSLARLLSLAQQQAPPSPCTALAADAQQNARLVYHEIMIDVRLANPITRGEYVRLLGEVLFNVGYRDVLGRLDRLLVVCYPRGRT